MAKRTLAAQLGLTSSTRRGPSTRKVERRRKRLAWEASESNWKTAQRNKARRKAGAAKAKSWLGI